MERDLRLGLAPLTQLRYHNGGMPGGTAEDAPSVRSWITPKAAKGGPSAIAGQGVHAVEAIAAGEVVAIKGGHIVDGAAVAGLPEAIRDSAFQIAADCFLAALTQDEFDGVMMRVNHSCEPNVGMGGNVLLVSMRDIPPGPIVPDVRRHIALLLNRDISPYHLNDVHSVLMAVPRRLPSLP
jgi:hypothetical protein